MSEHTDTMSCHLVLAQQLGLNPTTGRSMVVSASAGLNLRTGPGVSYAVIRVLPYNTRVLVLETSSGWARLIDGWCSLNHLS